MEQPHNKRGIPKQYRLTPTIADANDVAVTSRTLERLIVVLGNQLDLDSVALRGGVWMAKAEVKSTRI